MYIIKDIEKNERKNNNNKYTHKQNKKYMTGFFSKIKNHPSSGNMEFNC